jgi:hypothetical protein
VNGVENAVLVVMFGSEDIDMSAVLDAGMALLADSDVGKEEQYSRNNPNLGVT